MDGHFQKNSDISFGNLPFAVAVPSSFHRFSVAYRAVLRDHLDPFGPSSDPPYLGVGRGHPSDPASEPSGWVPFDLGGRTH